MTHSDERIRARLNFLEVEARARPRRHALRLIGLAALGYLYPILLLLVSFALVVGILSAGWLAWSSATAFVFVLYGAVLLGSLLIAAAILRTFWVELPVPAGHPLPQGDATPLREIVEEAREATGTPRIHHIHIDDRLNAAVSQRPKFGFWGPRTNYLIIGLPLMMVLSADQLRAVLAHEFGHLRGRHSSFNAWIYRVCRTWESLASPLKSTGWRWLVIGWFVRWFGEHFGISTVPRRRLHEYDADRRSADLCGALVTAQTLIAIDWAAYRLTRTFWPAVLREAGEDPLPPTDVMARMNDFFGGETEPDTLRRWISREQKSRTPISSVHPCLVDRLEAIGHRPMLDAGAGIEQLSSRSTADPSASSLSLLGSARDRVWQVTNAAWKVTAISRWRYEHAVAKFMKEKLAEGEDAQSEQRPGDREWEHAQFQIEHAPPAESLGALREFLVRFPQHPSANYSLGRVLLEQDDETAVQPLEIAMQHGSEYIGPTLHMLLDYYRETGRDADADPIRLRLEAHEQALKDAQKERTKVKRGDRFEPHDLSPKKVQQLRRTLLVYPQVRAAYLVRKQVRTFADQASYVLAIQRRPRWLEDNRRADKFLVNALTSQVPQSCAVVILSRKPRRLRSRILRAGGPPVFVAND